MGILFSNFKENVHGMRVINRTRFNSSEYNRPNFEGSGNSGKMGEPGNQGYFLGKLGLV